MPQLPSVPHFEAGAPVEWERSDVSRPSGGGRSLDFDTPSATQSALAVDGATLHTDF